MGRGCVVFIKADDYPGFTGKKVFPREDGPVRNQYGPFLPPPISPDFAENGREPPTCPVLRAGG